MDKPYSFSNEQMNGIVEDTYVKIIKECKYLKPELGCHLGIINSANNNIRQKASESNKWINEVLKNRTDWEKDRKIKPGYNDTRDMIQNIETYISKIGGTEGNYCQASSGSCETNTEVTTVIEDLSKLRYNSLQEKLDSLWNWYLGFMIFSIFLISIEYGLKRSIKSEYLEYYKSDNERGASYIISH